MLSALSLFGDSDTGKRKGNTLLTLNITQSSFSKSYTHSHTHKGLDTRTNRSRCGERWSRDRWERRGRQNNEEPDAPSAARERSMLSPFRREWGGSRRSALRYGE